MNNKLPLINIINGILKIMKGIKLNRGTSTTLIIYNGQTGDLLLENRIIQTFGVNLS